MNFYDNEYTKQREKEKKHSHIWKYREGSNIRVCESPFEMLVPGCGKKEIKINGVWNQYNK